MKKFDPYKDYGLVVPCALLIETDMYKNKFLKKYKIKFFYY